MSPTNQGRDKREPKVEDQTQTMEAAKLGKAHEQADPSRQTPRAGQVEKAASGRTTTSPDATDSAESGTAEVGGGQGHRAGSVGAEVDGFAFPTEQQAKDAARRLAQMASEPETWDAKAARRCGWVVDGYLLSQDASADACKDPVLLRSTTQPVTDAGDGEADWGKVFSAVHRFGQQQLQPKAQ